MATDHPILVVDDDDTIRETLVDFLEDNGYCTIGAVDGRDALNKLSTNENGAPCVILLDLMMPVMDGSAFREQQLKTPALAAVPTILMSAHIDVKEIAGTLDIVAYMAKPLKLERVLGFVRQLCPCLA